VAVRHSPVPDHGEKSYKGTGRLQGRKAVITGGDSGIGRAVALAYAREGADVLISYLNEKEDAKETERLVAEAGRKAVLISGDIQHAAYCREIIDCAISELGGVDILVNNAAHQASFKDIADISDEEWELTFKVNIHSMFYLIKAALPHMKPGSSIIKYGFDQFRQSRPDFACICDDKGRDSELHGGASTVIGREGYSSQCCGTRTDLDTADPFDLAGRGCNQFRQAGAHEAARSAGRACYGVRDVGRSSLKLRFRRNDCGDWWKADPVNAGDFIAPELPRSRINKFPKRLRKAAFFEQARPWPRDRGC
jgi:NAD(P)-dependent dehydrogenase (short-subunit alcohol dehydrogenase family)